MESSLIERQTDRGASPSPPPTNGDGHINGLLRPHHAKLVTTYKALDILCITLAFQASMWASGDGTGSGVHHLVVAFAVAAFLGMAAITDLYRSWRIAPVRQELINVWIAWLGVAAIVTLVTYGLPPAESVSRTAMLSWYAATPVVLSASRVALRFALRAARRQGRNTRSVAIIGANELGYELAANIEQAAWMGLRLIGVYDERNPGDGSRIKEHPKFPTTIGLESMYSSAKRGEVDMVFITLPMRAEHRISKLIGRFSDTTASVYVVPNFTVYDLLHSRWYTIGDLPVVSIYESPFYSVDGWLKRLEDFVLGSIALAIFSLPMLVIAIAVKLTSKGPVLYVQSRYGMDGREINVLKFRTMYQCEHDLTVVQATRDDRRVTPLGHFLRRRSLDELPQLFNVLRGQMSLVGPRPHAVSHNEMYRSLIKGYMLRHKVRPGMTGLAQINGCRGETETLDKMQARIDWDLAYIRQWTVSLDVWILLQTVWNGFASEHAY